MCCMSHMVGHPVIVVQHCVFVCVCPRVCTAQLVEDLRRVVIPRDLTYKFLLLADSNTARGIETCGVLCGKLVRHALTSNILYANIYPFLSCRQTASLLGKVKHPSLLCLSVQQESPFVIMSSANNSYVNEEGGCQCKVFKGQE